MSIIKRIWLLICIASCPLVASSDQFVFTTGDWRPYIFEVNGTVDASAPGFSIEIVDAVFEKMGHQITYRTAPFLRQIAETSRGKYLALVGVYKEEAPRLLFPQEPIGMTQNCFYTNIESNWKYTSPKQLSNINIAVIDGYTYGDIDTYIESNNEKIIALTGNEAEMMNRLVKLVEIGRVHTFVQDVAVAEHYFKQADIQDQIKSAGCLTSIPSMIGFAPEDPRSKDLVREFDIQLSKLRDTGELEQILNKYGFSDWKQ